VSPVAVAVPVVAPGRGAGSGPGPVPTVTAPVVRRWGRERRRGRELVLRWQGALVLRHVCLRIPVVEVAGGAVDEAAPRLGQRRVLRRVPWGRADGRASPVQHLGSGRICGLQLGPGHRALWRGR
jgi:hypothetical protein